MVSTTETAKVLVEAMEAATIVAKRIFGGIKFHLFFPQIFLFFSNNHTYKHKKHKKSSQLTKKSNLAAPVHCNKEKNRLFSSSFVI